MVGHNSFPARNQREREQEVGPGYKTSRDALMTHFLQQDGSIPKGSTTFPITATSWGASVQIPEPMGDSKHLNHGGVRWSREQRLLLRGLERESTEEVKLGWGLCNSASGWVITGGIVCRWTREGKRKFDPQPCQAALGWKLVTPGLPP